MEVIRCSPEAPKFSAIKSRLEAGLRKPAAFPTAEIDPDRYVSDSDALIEHFASKHKVDIETLPALSFYLQTIFPQLLRLHEQVGSDREITESGIAVVYLRIGSRQNLTPIATGMLNETIAAVT